MFMAAKEKEASAYTVDVNDFGIEITHYSDKPEQPYKNNFINRLLKRVSKIPSEVLGAGTVIAAFIVLFSSFYLVMASENLAPLAVAIVLVVPIGLGGSLLNGGVKDKFEKVVRESKINWLDLPKINKLSNKRKAVEEYFKKLPDEEIRIFEKNIEMLSKLTNKHQELGKLDSLMEENTVFKEDITKKKKIITDKTKIISEYLDDFEKKVMSGAVDEEFLSVMAAFDEFMTEEDSSFDKEEVLVETDRRASVSR